MSRAVQHRQFKHTERERRTEDGSPRQPVLQPAPATSVPGGFGKGRPQTGAEDASRQGQGGPRRGSSQPNQHTQAADSGDVWCETGPVTSWPCHPRLWEPQAVTAPAPPRRAGKVGRQALTGSLGSSRAREGTATSTSPPVTSAPGTNLTDNWTPRWRGIAQASRSSLARCCGARAVPGTNSSGRSMYLELSSRFCLFLRALQGPLLLFAACK